MRHKRYFLFLRLVLLAAAVCVYFGCEDEPSTGGIDAYFAARPYISDPRESEDPGDLSVTPSSAINVAAEQQVAFAVSGGRTPFEWGTARPAIGTVETQDDTRYAIYTHFGKTNDINNVIVNDRDGQAAIADINL